MSTLSLDSHAVLVRQIVELRTIRAENDKALKAAEKELKALIGDAEADEITLGGVPVFMNTKGPDKDVVDTTTLIASLSPRTVAKFLIRKDGQRSLRMAPGAAEVVARFFTRSAA